MMDYFHSCLFILTRLNRKYSRPLIIQQSMVSLTIRVIRHGQYQCSECADDTLLLAVSTNVAQWKGYEFPALHPPPPFLFNTTSSSLAQRYNSCPYNITKKLLWRCFKYMKNLFTQFFTVISVPCALTEIFYFPGTYSQ